MSIRGTASPCVMRLLVKLSKQILISSQHICLASRRISFCDEALTWGKKNSRIAQECLEIPRGNKPHTVAMKSTLKTRDLEQYLEMRRWKFPVEASEDVKFAKALASHVLSAPLTMAVHLLDQLVCPGYQWQKPRTLRWACIGARAEASLPVDYWKEIAILRKWYNQEPFQLELVFIGPEVPRRPSMILPCGGSSTLKLKWVVGTFHGVSYNAGSRNIVRLFDAFIMLNPGLGHEYLRESWTPTLELILEGVESGHLGPLLLTAHSKLDAERDSQRLLHFCKVAPIYKENEFASKVTYRDPYENDHFVRPNHFVTVVGGGK